MNTVSIDAVVDAQKVGRFSISIWLVCFLAMCVDGYDLTVIAFVAPEFVKAYGVDKTSLGMVFSASLVGMAFGAPLFAWMGDKNGRKLSIVLGCALFGAATLASLLASTANELALLRFVTGIGLGGVVPNLIAMSAEFAPVKLRGRVLTLVGTGVSLGAILPGILTATVVPMFGWQFLLVVGGVVPMAIAILALFVLPESIKYLALRPDRHADLMKLARRLDPKNELPADAKVVVHGINHVTGFSPAPLFMGGLIAVTSLLWIVFFTNLTTNFFITNWMPIVFRGAGLSAQQAGLTAAMFPVGGVLGSLVLAVLMGRTGGALVAAMFVAAVPIIALIGTPGLEPVMLKTLVLGAGFCVGGIQTGLIAMAGQLYPTAVRVKGGAWALSIGRIGAIIGPLVGAAVVARNLPTEQLFRVPAVPMAIGAVAAVVLAWLCYRRFGGWQLRESAAEESRTSQAPAVSRVGAMGLHEKHV